MIQGIQGRHQKRDNKLQDIRGTISIRELNDTAYDINKKPLYGMPDRIHIYKYTNSSIFLE